MRSLPVRRLLLVHQKHHGPARVVSSTKPGRALRIAGERVATLECVGPQDAVDVLAMALETVLELELGAARRIDKVQERLLELIERVRGADRRLALLMEVEERGQAQQAILADAAMKDPLTGLYNRRAFEGMAAAAARDCASREESVALLFVDVDHFKRVNDRLGHAVGDAALIEVAATLSRAGRRDDLVARWGGEEFVVLMPGCQLQDALPIAERLRASLASAEYASLPSDWRLTASIGVAGCLPSMGRVMADLQALIQTADERVYQAKSAGRDRVVPSPDLGLAQVA